MTSKHIMTNSKQQVKNLYSARVTEWAAYYADLEQQTLLARNLALRQRFALEMVECAVPRSSNVLDVGCGTGEMAAKLMRRGYGVRGLDIAEPMIRHARDRWASDRFQVGDIEHLPFADNTFDAAVCLGIIEYLDPDERALREIWRVLKPGGRAVVSTSNAISPLHLMDRVLVVLTAPARRLYYLVRRWRRGRQDPDPLHQLSRKVAGRRYSRWRWLQQLRSAGLQPEEWIGEGWGWYRSRLWLWVPRLFWPLALFRRTLEQLFGRARVSRALDGFARNRAFNWLLPEQLVLVRAVK
jgi:ubiquinone/menaquinone biosynthesis C-methylase UbiE